MKNLFRNSALGLAAAGMAVAAPAAAHGHRSSHEHGWHDQGDRYGYDTRFYGGDSRSTPSYRNAQTWRGDDGRYYCRRSDGTTGLIVGAAAGALLGRAVDDGRDRTLGTVIGGALGALLGRSVTQHQTCR